MEYKIGGKTVVAVKNNLYVATENKIVIFDIKGDVLSIKDELKIETVAHMTVSGDHRYIAMISIFGILYIYDLEKEKFIVQEKIMDEEGRVHFIEKNTRILIVGLSDYFYIYDIENRVLHTSVKSPASCSSVVNLNDEFYLIGLNKKSKW